VTVALCARAGPAERAQAAALLDAVFVTPRGRAPSFAERFPAAFADDGTSAVLVATEADEVAACAVVRLRRWAQPGGALASLGGICTHPAYRGRGLASALVQEAERVAAAWGARDFVLWTAQPAFYQRLGWIVDDPGHFGMLERLRIRDVSDPVTVEPVARVWAEIEEIRGRGAGGVLTRVALDYHTLPFPARTVECVLAKGGAYALVGVEGDSAYVYEVEGDPQAFGGLWSAVAARHGVVRINDRPGSASWAWLEAHAEVAWRPAPLALWKGERRAYIPFLDRL
jgi:GNAT superfamily N-acetyltransferase